MTVIEEIEKLIKGAEKAIDTEKGSLKIISDLHNQSIALLTTILEREQFLLDFLRKCPTIKNQENSPAGENQEEKENQVLDGD